MDERLRKMSKVLSTALVLCMSVTVAPAQDGRHPHDVFWHRFPVLNGQTGLVDAILSHGGDLYIGGRFQRVEGALLYNCARWDGTEWTPVGGAIGTPQMGLVHVVVIDGDKTIIGGMFDIVSGVWPASNIAIWDGVNWDDMAGGTDRAIRAIAVAPNGDVYAGGEFMTAGGVPSRGIARWDGKRWHTLGEGDDNHVSGITVHDGDIYVGGRFSSAGGQRIANIARWDGSTWHALGSGIDGFVTALRSRGNRLYVGGGFKFAGGRQARSIASWNGKNWSALGAGVSGPGVTFVRSILVDGKYVYAGGFFKRAGGMEVGYIARWDGKEWEPLGSGLDYTVYVNSDRLGRLDVKGERISKNLRPGTYKFHFYDNENNRESEPIRFEVRNGDIRTFIIGTGDIRIIWKN